MDFVADQQAFRLKFLTLTIVRVFSKEALAVEVIIATLRCLVDHSGTSA
jgi:hypothetical protein